MGTKKVLLPSFIIFAVAYLGFAVTQDILLIAGLFVFYGLYEGIFRSVGKAFASDFVPKHLRAGGIGWYSTTIGLLQLVASVIAGVLWDTIGHAAVFYYGVAFGRRRQRRPSVADPGGTKSNRPGEAGLKRSPMRD